MTCDPDRRNLRSTHQSTAKTVCAGTNPASRTEHAGQLIAADIQLIQLLVDRESGAWQRFVDQYQKLIYSRVLQTLNDCSFDASATEDVCAEVFVSLLHDNCASLRKFQGRSRLSTWLFVVVRRICLRYVSGWKSLRTVGLSDPAIDLTAAPDAASDELHCDDLRAMRVALGELSQGDQTVLKMFYFESESYHEIGRRMNISVNTVGPKLHRATKRLRKVFDQRSAAG